MNDHTQLIARVAGRNPVPNLDDPPIGAWDVDVVRSAVTERDTAMLTDKRPTRTTPAPTGHRRGWLVAFASFAIILAAAGTLWFASRSPAPGDVAGEPPTTNAPSNEMERVALETLVAYYTVDEAAFRALAAFPSSDFVDSRVREMRREGATNTRTDSINCVLGASGNNSVVTCEMMVKGDVLDVFGIDETPVTTDITVVASGWTHIETTGYPRATPRIEAWLDDLDPGLFAEGAVCNTPQTQEDCGLALLEDARRWVAENG